MSVCLEGRFGEVAGILLGRALDCAIDVLRIIRRGADSPWRAAKQHLQLIKKTERETEPKWHSPHARDNQLQVGSRGDPI
jgi:hypothetical protein